MELVIYSLPFIIAIILLVFFKKYIVWWEYICLVLVSLLFTIMFRALFIASLETDTEYLGAYMTRITHYDEWDEWVHRTCTRTVHDGYDSDGKEITHEEEYDCSYRDYHPECWTYMTSDSRWEHYFYDKAEFDRAMAELGYPKMVFRDMHRNYYRIDGDAQDYFYDGTVEHIRAIARTNTYKNKILASRSIFKFQDISDKQADSLGLFRYPKVIDNDQDVVLGFKCGKAVHKKYKYINSIYGAKKQFRIFVLVFRNKPLEISELQKSYWQGGNKNEFVLCLGYNTKTGRIDWCNPFSWCDKPELEVATKRYFREHPKMDLSQYPAWLEKNLKLWKRKEFKDFEYIDNELTKGQAIALFIIIFIMDIFMSMFFIGNEFTNEEIYDNTFLRDFKSYQRITMDGIGLFFGGITLGIISSIWKVSDTLLSLDDVFEKYKYWK